MINSILMPIIRKEFDSLLAWIEHCPNPGIECNLFFSIDNKWNREEKIKIIETISNSAFFDKKNVYFIDCMIPDSESFYIREKNKKINLNKYPYGAKSGPNKQFFISMKKIIDNSCAQNIILLEVDAFPVKNCWLRAINQRTNWAKDVYIIGARVKENKISPSIKTHVNGNSVYFIRAEGFVLFINKWEQILLDLLKKNHGLAYDVALDYYKNTAKNSEYCDNLLITEYEKKIFELPNLILNLYNMDDQFNSIHDIENYIKKYSYIIIHGKILSGKKDILKDYYKKKCI